MSACYHFLIQAGGFVNLEKGLLDVDPLKASAWRLAKAEEKLREVREVANVARLLFEKNNNNLKKEIVDVQTRKTKVNFPLRPPVTVCPCSE